ncbi:MAG: Crp/Fnr family transcriptional regulator [Bacteroidetes bacterium]|nr:Crp/Fnr family transcriptional regulator [Bacteroidota bacterium]
MNELYSEELLRRYGATLIRLNKNEIIFGQGERAEHFYVVCSGKVKMSHFSDEGREFVQGYFTAGQSFGEPPLLASMNYPATALAVEESTVYSLPQPAFLEMLRDNFDVHYALLETLGKRLMYKSMMLSEVAVEEAEHRLKSLMAYFKRSRGLGRQDEFVVPFTRQQLADMTGLRVETVIRTIKHMEQEGQLEIIEGKIFWTPKRSKTGAHDGNNESNTPRTR